MLLEVCMCCLRQRWNIGKRWSETIVIAKLIQRLWCSRTTLRLHDERSKCNKSRKYNKKKYGRNSDTNRDKYATITVESVSVLTRFLDKYLSSLFIFFLLSIHLQLLCNKLIYCLWRIARVMRATRQTAIRISFKRKIGESACNYKSTQNKREINCIGRPAGGYLIVIVIVSHLMYLVSFWFAARHHVHKELETRRRWTRIQYHFESKCLRTSRGSWRCARARARQQKNENDLILFSKHSLRNDVRFKQLLKSPQRLQ